MKTRLSVGRCCCGPAFPCDAWGGPHEWDDPFSSDTLSSYTTSGTVTWNSGGYVTGGDGTFEAAFDMGDAANNYPTDKVKFSYLFDWWHGGLFHHYYFSGLGLGRRNPSGFANYLPTGGTTGNIEIQGEFASQIQINYRYSGTVSADTMTIDTADFAASTFHTLLATATQSSALVKDTNPAYGNNVWTANFDVVIEVQSGSSSATSSISRTIEVRIPCADGVDLSTSPDGPSKWWHWLSNNTGTRIDLIHHLVDLI